VFKISQFEKDLQNSESIVSISIDKVGIIGVEKKVDIIQENRKYSFYPTISALISLPSQQRGIHMSRTSETIEEIINEVVFKPASGIETVADRIAKKLFERHKYTNRVEVKLEGKVVIPLKENSHRTIQKSYEVLTEVYGTKNAHQEIEYEYFIGAHAVSATVCPCGKSMSKEYSEQVIRNRTDINISEEDLQKILQILPLASHNQRSKGTIKLQIQDPAESTVDILDLIEVIEESMSGKIQSVLKRPEEAELIRTSHLNPLFSEDVIRNMAKNFILKNFSELKDEYDIDFKIESYESIHPYNVYSELNTTIGELRNSIKFRNPSK
jgi:GTP cyclohydrolase-4